MKVILTADVDFLGREGDVKEVKNGLARNFLLPKKLAVRATPGNLKIWEQKSGLIKKKQEQQQGEAEGVAQKLEGVELLIPVKVGEEEKLFGSVTSQNIADELAQQGFDIERKHIGLDSPIKSLGNYEIKVKLYHEVAPTIMVHVVDEENPVPVEDKPEPEVQKADEDSHEPEPQEEPKEAESKEEEPTEVEPEQEAQSHEEVEEVTEEAAEEEPEDISEASEEESEEEEPPEDEEESEEDKP